MKAEQFKTPAEMVAFVATNAIVQSKIVSIWWVRGTWWLFYYV